jgi:hypothetical protein
MRFTNPQHALRWAFETCNKPIVTVSTSADSRELSRSGETASNGSLNQRERHAQAALILSLCERSLSPLHMAYIRVQFGREASGFDLLAHHLAANFGTGIHCRRTIVIIRAYCGEKIGLRDIRKSMSCRMLKAVSYRNQAYDLLDSIHLQAMERLRAEMDKKGLLSQVRALEQSL